MKTESANQLRELATRLDRVVTDHPAMSVAYPIVANCCDHLRALARIHDLQAAQAKT